MSIGIKGVQARRASQSLAWDSLNDIAGNNMLFKLGNVCFIPTFSDVARGFQAPLDGRLDGLRRLRAQDQLRDATDFGHGGSVGEG